MGRVGGLQMERMHEIGMQALRPERQRVEQRMRPGMIKRVPAHMGYLERRIAGRDGDDITWNPAEALGLAMFEPACRHQLHADTDAQEWLAPARHLLHER